ncbi:uncharacterized protein LOC132658609 [Ovis aries]|uniref:uncharacterized protein LOC132658609 n=1 Tax=Ovis aries TaxID=9940 RepID=UPI00295278F8|nr:uncharacterized protein LOC132658609 [Ovis aries]
MLELGATHKEVQTAKEQEWERVQQASVLGDGAQVFQSDEAVSDGEGDRVTLFSPASQLLPSGQADAKTQSMRLQEQLDAVNEEISLVEEEKENMEQRAEDTESREGRGRLGSLHRCNSVSSLNLLAGSSAAGSCPPLPKPRRRRHCPAQEGDQLGIMTVVCVCLLRAHPSPRTWVFFILFVFWFFSFYLEENRVHLLHSEVYTFLNCLVFNHSTMAQQRISLDIWTTGLAHHHELSQSLPLCCWAWPVPGTAAAGKFLFSGSRQLRESNHRQPSWRGKPCSTCSIGAAWLQRAGHAVGTKPRISMVCLQMDPAAGSGQLCV